MKTKEELLKIYSAYLPYGLTAETVLKTKFTFKGLSFRHVLQDEKGFDMGQVGATKLHLYSMDMLTKEIEHKGEKFIPIEKLFDIETGLNWSASNYIKSVKGKDEFWVRKNENGRSFSFGYNSENKYFYYIDADGFNTSVKKQFELFQKLFEWHFDIFGLIEQGLAVDINTLEILP